MNMKLIGGYNAIEGRENRIVMVHTPTGALAIVRNVAEKLLTEGVICGQIDGPLHANEAATVKAAIMAHSVCDFCSVPGATELFDVPDFELPEKVGVSVGGWMACDQCAALITANKRSALLERSLTTLAFPKFTKSMVQGVHHRFWAGMDAIIEARGIMQGVKGFVDDEMLRHKANVSPRSRRVETVARLIGISESDVESLIRGDKLHPSIALKLVEWRNSFGTKTGEEVASMLSGGVKPPLPQGHIPHWQRALDARFGAIALLSRAMSLNGSQDSIRFNDTIDLNDPVALKKKVAQAQSFKTLRDLGFREDLRYLQAADSYSFNQETIEAIREAAKSIPHDSPLSAVETPNIGAGWFWFSDPIPVTASPAASNETNALLWGWSNGQAKYRIDLSKIVNKLSPELVERIKGSHVDLLDDEEIRILGKALRESGVTQEEFDQMAEEVNQPSLMFSAYVLDKKGLVTKSGEPMPSTRWYWPLDMSYDEMIEYNGRGWDKTYGPGTKFEHSADIIGREETLTCIGELSLFFLAACVWFKQKIVVATPGHIERHARKRYVKEHKLKEQPTVRVIALRASLKEPGEPREPREGESPREYHYRWIVKGHPRLQVCGPGRRDRKLIWIDPYPKGPEDKPLRTREKVYAVIR